ncbi:hypothetical protein MyChFU_22020 [Mycobacterium intracellulare subsp. chimaera]|nr:hypothetical protein L842_4105 [Mycobacterium intracellulare MIN_052511_1280]
MPLGGQRGAQLLGVLPDHVIAADDCDLHSRFPPRTSSVHPDITLGIPPWGIRETNKITASFGGRQFV